jgi:hypothetical protein
MNDTREATSSPNPQAGLPDPTSHGPKEESGRAGKSRKPRASSSVAEATQASRSSARKPKCTNNVAPPGANKNRRPSKARVVKTPGVNPERVPSPTDLASLAAAIRDEIRAGHASMSKGLDHFRRAGEMLVREKARIGHGGFGKYVSETFEFSLETANVYMRVYLGWSILEEKRRANPESATDLTLAKVVKQLAKPRKKPVTKGDPATPGAIDEVAPEGSTLPACQDLPIAHARSPEPVRADPVDLGTIEARSDGPPAAALMDPPAVDPIRPEVTGKAGPARDLGVGDDPVRPRHAAAGDAAAGAVITEPSRPRAEDLIALLKRCQIRARLKKAKKRRDFDADAGIWCLLRPIAAEVMALREAAGRERGLIAPLIIEFILTRSPEEWELCTDCGGEAVLESGGGPCPKCDGRGYWPWG